MNDSGAGRIILSKDALIAQGFPKSVIDANVGTASQNMQFECGGGDINSSKSIGLTGPNIGQTEGYVLDKAPFAASMGEIVASGRPLIWITGQKPFHVNDQSKLKIICPLKNRQYADRVEENVPIFKEDITIGEACPCPAAMNFLQSSALPAAIVDSEFVCVPCGEDLDDFMTVPDVPCDGCVEEIVEDPTLRMRSMSKRALILEANSPAHRCSHYPHNPFCEICVRSHMRQKSVARKKEREDDGLVAITLPRQRLSADHMIVEREKSAKY